MPTAKKQRTQEATLQKLRAQLGTASYPIHLDAQTFMCRVNFGRYKADGSITIRLLSPVEGESDAYEPFGTLTTCLPDSSLGPDEILLKTWSENKGWARQFALARGWKLVRTVPTGFVDAEVWNINPQPAVAPETRPEPSRYEKAGYESRDDYLEALADDYDVPMKVVWAFASLLGPEEDFDGLISELQMYNSEHGG